MGCGFLYKISSLTLFVKITIILLYIILCYAVPKNISWNILFIIVETLKISSYSIFDF